MYLQAIGHSTKEHLLTPLPISGIVSPLLAPLLPSYASHSRHTMDRLAGTPFYCIFNMWLVVSCWLGGLVVFWGNNPSSVASGTAVGQDLERRSLEKGGNLGIWGPRRMQRHYFSVLIGSLVDPTCPQSTNDFHAFFFQQDTQLGSKPQQQQQQQQ